MESALGWIGELIHWITNLIPRWAIVNKTHKGVAFVRGKHVREINPGMLFYWPFWTELLLYPVVRQSLNLPSQTLTTQDGYPVTISAVIIYKIDDIKVALAEQWDLSETIQDLSMAAVRETVSDTEFDSLMDNWRDVDTMLKEQINSTLKEYGVDIMDARITDFAQTKVVTLIGGGGEGYVEEEEED